MMPSRQHRLTESLLAADIRKPSAGDETFPGGAIVPVRRLSALVAESSRTNGTVIGKVLELAGYDAVLVHDRASTLQALECERFDVVLVALDMPLAHEEDRAEYGCPPLGGRAVPVVALIADTAGDAEDRCLRAGIEAWVAKPIEPQRLLRAVDTAFARHRARFDQGSDGETGRTAQDHDSTAQLDRSKLAELENLAGRDFVGGLIDQFLRDASRILLALGGAVAERDVTTFRAQAHALRSCAINLGAHGLFELCLGWRNVTDHELARGGARMLDLLTKEFSALQKALSAYRAP